MNDYVSPDLREAIEFHIKGHYEGTEEMQKLLTAYDALEIKIVQLSESLATHDSYLSLLHHRHVQPKNYPSDLRFEIEEAIGKARSILSNTAVTAKTIKHQWQIKGAQVVLKESRKVARYFEDGLERVTILAMENIVTNMQHDKHSL